MIEIEYFSPKVTSICNSEARVHKTVLGVGRKLPSVCPKGKCFQDGEWIDDPYADSKASDGFRRDNLGELGVNLHGPAGGRALAKTCACGGTSG